MRKGKIILYIIGIVFVCSVIYMLFFLNNIKDLSTKISLSASSISKNLIDLVGENSKDDYVDENEMEIGLYIDEGNTKRLINKYYSDFTAENIIGLFYALPTREGVVNGRDFKQIFDEYYNHYEDKEKYQIGYNI